jgi:hypothetical protein
MRSCAAVTAALLYCVGGVSSAQVSPTVGHVGPSRAAYDAMPAPKGKSKSRLPTVPASVIQRAASSPATALPGAPGIAPTSSDGERVYRHSAASGIEPNAYGTIRIPYTTKRVAVRVVGPGGTAAQMPVTSAPFRITGDIEVTFNGEAFDCTGALIRKGILLTAAHCIHEYGQGNAGYADAIRWIPGEYSAAAGGPYGVWTGRFWVVPGPYRLGTDTCAVDGNGVVCNNDVALVVLNRRTINGVLTWPGRILGYYAYAVNGYSSVVSPLLGNKRVVQTAQLGYPSAFDNSVQMQRTDSIGIHTTQSGANTTNGKTLRTLVIGSAQTGGSSGGPWLANFGVTPVIDPNEANHGAQPNQVVIGVTSFGTDGGPNDAGSSYFGQNAEFPNANYGPWGAGNIGFLLNFVCSQAAYSAACAP